MLDEICFLIFIILLLKIKEIETHLNAALETDEVIEHRHKQFTWWARCYILILITEDIIQTLSMLMVYRSINIFDLY